MCLDFANRRSAVFFFDKKVIALGESVIFQIDYLFYLRLPSLLFRLTIDNSFLVLNSLFFRRMQIPLVYQ